MLKLYDLECENFIAPIGLGTAKPRFSWKIHSDLQNCMQISYQIQISKDGDFSKILWDSGIVSSEQSRLCEYTGEPLSADTGYFFRVKIEDNHSEKSEWETSKFETGILNYKDFTADFISSPLDKPEDSHAVYFRNGFEIKKEIKKAKAYVTALGMYDFYVNGQKIGDAYFAPGFLSYNNHLQVQAYDVTSNILQGKNVIGAIVGAGWYKGDLISSGSRNHYGSKNALFVQLHITYTDGTKQLIITDKNWESCFGAIIYSELYHGEIFDARIDNSDWCKGTANGDFVRSEKFDFDKSVMRMQTGEFVREQQVLKPAKKIKTPSGETVFDFGQNMVGFIRVKIKGKKGDRIRLNFAEVLDKEGNFYTENMRSARNDIIYILSGNGEEILQPHFTFQGFRYVKILEFPGEPEIENFEGVVLDSDMSETGKFECSNSLINRLVKNVGWGFKGNSVDVPTPTA